MGAITIIHNAVTPYRLPLFEKLNHANEVNVLFCEFTTPDRRWESSLSACGFKSTALWSARVGPVVINPGILLSLARARGDIYVVADNSENLISILATMLVAKARRKPVIIWNEHVLPGPRASPTGVLRVRALVQLIDRIYRRWAYREAKVLVSMSGEYSDRFIDQFDVPPGKVVTGTQVMPEELIPIPEVEQPRGRPYLLYLGYLRPEKRVGDAIAAFMRSRQIEWDLIVAGTGPEEQALRDLAWGDSRIRFVGYVDGTAKATLIQQAEVLIITSEYEPWGLVVNEALALGTPVMASAATAATTLFPAGLRDLIFEVADVHQLGKLIENFAEDPVWRAQAREAVARIPAEVLSSAEYGIKALQEAVARCGGADEPRSELPGRRS